MLPCVVNRQVRWWDRRIVHLPCFVTGERRRWQRRCVVRGERRRWRRRCVVRGKRRWRRRCFVRGEIRRWQRRFFVRRPHLIASGGLQYVQICCRWNLPLVQSAPSLHKANARFLREWIQSTALDYLAPYTKARMYSPRKDRLYPVKFNWPYNSFHLCLIKTIHTIAGPEKTINGYLASRVSALAANSGPTSQLNDLAGQIRYVASLLSMRVSSEAENDLR